MVATRFEGAAAMWSRGNSISTTSVLKPSISDGIIFSGLTFFTMEEYGDAEIVGRLPLHVHLRGSAMSQATAASSTAARVGSNRNDSLVPGKKAAGSPAFIGIFSTTSASPAIFVENRRSLRKRIGESFGASSNLNISAMFNLI